MEEPTIADLFRSAKEGKWVELRNVISQIVLEFNDFLKKDPDSGNCDFTILHHACHKDDGESASIGVCEIFKALKSYEYTSDELFNFVNLKDQKGRTALHIVLEKDCSDADTIMLLLNNGADINTKTFSDIQKKYRRLVLTIFDRGLTLKKNRGDLENDELWTLECNFRCNNYSEKMKYDMMREISGYESKLDKENGKYRESKQLATILDHPNANQTDILGHPLVQLFLIAKRKRFQILIWFSIFCHILWSILSAAYITCNVTSFSTNVSSNESRHMIDSENWNPCNYSFISYIPIFGLTMLIKEITELFLSRSKWFYVKQAENVGQWVVLIIVTFVTFFNFFETMDNFRRSGIFIAVCLIGLVPSLILIQAQFTKIETLGIYQQLMTKGFWKILKLLLVFSPLLATYLLLFKLLIPANSSYNINWGLGIGKILAGMTGELNYDELFADESVEKMISEYAVKAILILFIITIVILFQNMLIALSFDDIERLKAKATVAHLATTLEVIYLMESFLMHDIVLHAFDFFKVKDKVVHHFCVNELKSESKSKSEQTKVEVNGTINTFGCYSYRYCCWDGGSLAQSSPPCQSSPPEEIPLQQNITPLVTFVDGGQQTTKHQPFEQKFIGLPRKLRESIKDRAENEKNKLT